MKEINVKEVIGQEFNTEDAIIVKRLIKENINDEVTLDFEGINNVPSGFFASLLYDIMGIIGRDYFISHLSVKNLSNIKDFQRVLWGTSFNY